MPPSLDRENALVLDLVSAMLGALSPNFRRVTLEPLRTGARLRFLLEHDDPVDREEIEDIVFELEALQDRPLDIEVIVLVDPRPFEELKLPGRPVYGRREVP